MIQQRDGGIVKTVCGNAWPDSPEATGDARDLPTKL